MKRLVLWLLVLPLCGGCGWVLQRRPLRASPEIAAGISFPADLPAATSTQLDGPTAAAVMIALGDFTSPEWKLVDDEDPIARCLGRPDMYDVTAMRAQGVTFVRLVPNLARCPVQMPILDAGAEYAISDEGVILAVRQ